MSQGFDSRVVNLIIMMCGIRTIRLHPATPNCRQVGQQKGATHPVSHISSVHVRTAQYLLDLSARFGDDKCRCRNATRHVPRLGNKNKSLGAGPGVPVLTLELDLPWMKLPCRVANDIGVGLQRTRVSGQNSKFGAWKLELIQGSGQPMGQMDYRPSPL